MTERERDESTETSGDEAKTPSESETAEQPPAPEERTRTQPPGEKGGPKGPEPTRFGDWEKNGRCFDF